MRKKEYIMSKNRKTIPGTVRPRPNKENVSYYDVILEMGKDPLTGKRKQIRFRVDTTDRKEAEKQLLLKQAEMVQGEILEPSKMTVEQYLREYYEIYMQNKVSPTTERDYLFVINGYLVPVFGKIQLQKLTYSLIQKTYYQWQKESPKGKKPLALDTVKHINRVFKAALNQACKLGYIKDNPTRGIKFAKDSEHKSLEVFTVEEIQGLQKAVKGTDMELPIALLFDCVMRRGELLGLKYSDIDFENKIVNIQHSWVETPDSKKATLKSCKTDSSEREIVVTQRTIELLKRQRTQYKCNRMKYGENFCDEGFVVCKENGEPFLPHSFTQKWARTLKKYGIRHLKLHATRHSAISMLLSEGIPLHMVQARAGHQNPEITLSVYSHVAKDKQSVVAEKLETLLIS